MKKVSKIILTLVWLICLGIGVIHINSTNLSKGDNTMDLADSGIGEAASAVPVKLNGLSVINTGLPSDITLLASEALPIRQSNVISLTPGKTYILTFDYVTSGQKNVFNVDLFPDSLPEIWPEATTSIKHYEWNIKSNNNDIKNCRVRFFDNQKKSSDQNINISGIKLLDIDANKSMSYMVTVGHKLGSSLPSIPKDGYVFDGWYTASSGGTKVNAETVVTNSLNLYPRWKEITISLSKTQLNIVKGNSETLVATVSPSNAPNKTVTWSSSNTSIATVDGNGKVVGKAIGTATITARNSNGKTATCTVKVINKMNNPITVTASQSWSTTFSTSAQTKSITAATNAQGSVTYAITSQPSGNYFTISGTTLTKKANTPVGTYKVIVRATAAGNANYNSGYKDITVSVGVSKILSPITVPTNQSLSYNYSTSAQTKSITGVTNAQGAVTYAITSQPSGNYFTISGTALTKKANTPVGIYKVIVRVTAEGNANYLSSYRDITVSISVGKYTDSIVVKIGAGGYYCISNSCYSIKLADVSGSATWNSIKTNNNISWESRDSSIVEVIYQDNPHLYDTPHYDLVLNYGSIDKVPTYNKTTTLVGKINNQVVAEVNIQVKPASLEVIFENTNVTRTYLCGEKIGQFPALNMSGYSVSNWYWEGHDVVVDKDTYVRFNQVITPEIVPILPEKYNVPSGYLVSNSYSSSTLKYKTINENGTNNYYSLIWVEDAYNQLNSANNSLNGGTKVALLNQEINTVGYQNKGMIAVNGSFTVHDRANIPVIVTRGNMVNNSKYETADIYAYGTLTIGKDGILQSNNPRDVNMARSWLNGNSSRNTWAITSFETSNWNGGIDGGSDRRTAICQVDKKDFVLYTGYSSGIHDYMKKLHDMFGCKSVANLDGGGSSGIYYKNNSMSTISSIYQYDSNRVVADMLYFVEK